MGINVGEAINSKENTILDYISRSWDESIVGGATLDSDVASYYWSTDREDLETYSGFMKYFITSTQILNLVYF